VPLKGPFVNGIKYGSAVSYEEIKPIDCGACLTITLLQSPPIGNEEHRLIRRWSMLGQEQECRDSLLTIWSGITHHFAQ